MNHEKLRRVLQLALAGLIRTMKEQQQNILLKKEFGTEAILHTTFYEPGKPKQAEQLWGNLEQEYHDNLKFATEIQEALDKESEEEWEKFSEIFINNLKS